MNKNKKQRGFTIVELVIVIAVIGILAAVLIPTFSNLVKKAKESADQQLVYHINVAAAANEVENGKASTMYDTLQALENEYGFTIEKMTPRSGCDIVWDSVTNRFALVENGTTIKYGDPNKPSNMTNKAQMWKITTPTDSLEDGYSHYLTADWTGTVEVTTGVDVGENDDITSVTYANDGEAQTAVIRTNSANTTLTIDDKSTGTINHYGSAGELNIIQCHTASYHENGNVAFAEIAKGRIVLESGSEIKHIHVNAKEDDSGNSLNEFDTIIIADNGAKALPEAITRDQVDVSVAKPVVTVESGSTSETVYVYPYTDSESTKTGTTEQTATQNTTIASALGQLVLDNGSDAGEKAMSNNQKEEAKTEVVDTAVEKEDLASEENANARYWIDIAADEFAGGEGTKEEPYLISSARQLALLAEIMAGYNTEKPYAKYCDKYYKLTKDIDLAGKVWISIGIGNSGDDGINAFKGHIDGNNKTVYNMSSLDATYDELKDHKMGTWSTALGKTVAQDGFVGYAKDASVKNLYIVGAVFENPKFTKSGFVVCYADGNIVLENCHVDSTSRYSGQSNIGGLVGIYNGKTPNKLIVKDCTVSASIKVHDASSSGGRGAGFLGAAYDYYNSIYAYNSEFNGKVEGTAIGGFIGRSAPNVSHGGLDAGIHFVNCNMFGKLEGTDAGLLIGYQTDGCAGLVTLDNCKYKINGEGDENTFTFETSNLMGKSQTGSALWLGINGEIKNIEYGTSYTNKQGAIDYLVNSSNNSTEFVVESESTLYGIIFNLQCNKITGKENSVLTITTEYTGNTDKNFDLTGENINFYTQDGKLITKLWTGNKANDGTLEYTHTVTFNWDTVNSRWILADGLDNLVTVNE